MILLFREWRSGSYSSVSVFQQQQFIRFVALRSNQQTRIRSPRHKKQAPTKPHNTNSPRRCHSESVCQELPLGVVTKARVAGCRVCCLSLLHCRCARDGRLLQECECVNLLRYLCYNCMCICICCGIFGLHPVLLKMLLLLHIK